uniref:Uncharacterized protein n=1 Tax=Globodera rostochiensis TaxID=31243 RepID=A0A914HJ35_GLORO
MSIRERNRKKWSDPLIIIIFSLSTSIFGIRCSLAIPRRGNEPWSIILCKFKDLTDYEPRSREWFQQWLNGSRELDSIEQFFWQLSNGVYSIAGSNVYGWFTLAQSQKEVLHLATKTVNTRSEIPPIGSEMSFDYFDKVKELCVQSAIANGSVLHRQKITVVNAGTAAVYGKRNGVLLTPQLMFSSVLTHEMVHSFFIGHSYSDRKIKVFPYAADGEYDDRYDLMSTANAYMHRSNFGMNGPGLNGAHLDYLGWLPMDRVLYFGRDGRKNFTLRISSLSVPHNKTIGWLLVMVPYDRDDPNNYYTVELRTPHQFDRGIAQPSILIHKVQRNGDSYYSQLISQADYYELTDENTEWVTFLEPFASATAQNLDSNGQNSMKNFQFIRVTVRHVYLTDADVHISSTFDPAECHIGERLLRPERWSQPHTIGLRHICLPRSDAGDANVGSEETKGSMKPPSTASRRMVRILNDTEMDKQFARMNFFALRQTYGANTCRSGFVWRRLDTYDYVCVTARRKQNAQQEDKNNANRTTTEQKGETSGPSSNSLCVEPIYRPTAL